jgi:hypothetical protein
MTIPENKNGEIMGPRRRTLITNSIKETTKAAVEFTLCLWEGKRP